MLVSWLGRECCDEEWREADALGVELRQALPECGRATPSALLQVPSPAASEEEEKAI